MRPQSLALEPETGRVREADSGPWRARKLFCSFRAVKSALGCLQMLGFASPEVLQQKLVMPGGDPGMGAIGPGGLSNVSPPLAAVITRGAGQGLGQRRG